jgi:ATP-binding cassette subfamily B protein
LDAISQLAKNHTSVVIAHRLSTIVDADKIILLDQGRVVEQGTHTELLALNGRYAQMWIMQLQNEKE